MAFFKVGRALPPTKQLASIDTFSYLTSIVGSSIPTLPSEISVPATHDSRSFRVVLYVPGKAM